MEEYYQGAIDEYVRLCMDIPVPFLGVQVVYHDSKRNRFFTIAMLLEVKIIEAKATIGNDSHLSHMILQFNQFVAGLT